MDLSETWQATLGELELTLSKANFTTWFKSTFISSNDGGKIVISVPNTFTKAWLEKKYHEAIVRALRNVTSNNVREVAYRVEVRNTTTLQQFAEQIETTHPVSAEASVQTHSAGNGSMADVGLNPRYLFEHFVVGKANE